MTKPSRFITNIKRYFIKSSEQTLPRLPSKRCSRSAASSAGSGNRESTFDFERVAINEHIPEDKTAIMPKSNKFDYSKKKNTGVSLGQFIAKQLDGEADAVKRAAERAARKSTSSSHDLDADTSVTHHIDLKVPGKDLGDDGLAVLCDGLEAALRKGTPDASLALEDIDLTDNALTTAGLARFAAVISMARYNVKTIVLANNAISVDTDQQAKQWETFLRSFASCQTLRRLDLSGNPGLGRRAMEIFAMVHVREPQIDPIRTVGDTDVLSLHSKHDGDLRARSGSLKLEVNGDAGRPHQSMSDWCMLTRRCGLRSIPFISLKECGLTDAGALWLSYVIEDHYFPVQLVSELNAALADSSVEAYKQDSKVHGIDWLSNEDSLGKDGLSLLIKTETVRKQTVLDDRSTLPGSVIAESPTDTVAQGTGIPADGKASRAGAGNRRVSLKSTASATDDEQGLNELDSWRKRIQRQIIAHDHAKSADLWHAALQLLCVARCLLMTTPTSRMIYTGSKLSVGAPDELKPLSIRIVSPTGPARPIKERQKVKLSVEPVKTLSPTDESYAGTLGSPEVALTDVTNTPTTPKRVFKPHRKDAFSHGADAMTVTEKLSGLAIRITSSAEYLQYQEKRKDGQGEHAYRDVGNPCHLPEGLLTRILNLAFGDRQMGLMSESQKKVVVALGMDRETLITGLQGKDPSYRAWMLLDKIKCLEYASV